MTGFAQLPTSRCSHCEANGTYPLTFTLSSMDVIEVKKFSPSLILVVALLVVGCADKTGLEIGDEVAVPTENVNAGAERGTHLNILYWQAPSILNPYLSGGTKDIEAASMILEPLAHFDERGEMVPILAAEIPTRENGGVAEDLTSITWTLKPQVVFSDGTPLTAHDVVFTGEYCLNEQAGCNPVNSFSDVESLEALDDLTVRINFRVSKPHPYGPFVGSTVPVLQKAQFADCLGLKAQECTEQNFGPIGTGPFVVAEFRANDTVSYHANENYREAGKPFFRSATLKGGGEAASAARAVLETGEYDYAWNLQVEPEILENMAKAGYGQIVSGLGSQVERLIVNLTNPSPALDLNTRSHYLDGSNPHPFLTDIKVRKALSLAIDRSILVTAGYGSIGGVPTCNVIPAPQRYVSLANDACKIQDIVGANQLLDEAGWEMGTDGVRTKDGMRLSILYQTSTNSVRQGTQALIKQMWEQIGVETELRNIDGAVFFGSDPASPDTFQKFFADIQMYTNNFDGTDPSAYVQGWRCSEIPGPNNQWVGANVPRACSEEYETVVATMANVLDPDERAKVFIQLNDIVVQNYWLIPLVQRAKLAAISNSLRGVRMNAWDSELWNVADWSRAMQPTG